MITTGIVKRLDDLGRFAIPEAVRKRAFGTNDAAGKAMEIFYENDGTIILKPYEFAKESKYGHIELIEPTEVKLDAQCCCCGTPMGSQDNFCPNCGMSVIKE